MSAARGQPDQWRPENYRVAVAEGLVKPAVKRTLLAMLDAGLGEYTTIDRATLCELTGVRREATISEHWRRARDAGLLESRARYNRSSVHRLNIPGVQGQGWEVFSGGSVLVPHPWTDEELAWWRKQSPESPIPPPWLEGSPPF